MPLAGNGMLLNFLNVDPAVEDDFNRWYDTEHLEERVRIEGFLDARRYVSSTAKRKYLGVYVTETLNVLDSESYRHRLANQTQWSLDHISKFKDVIRSCANVISSRGFGRGAYVTVTTVRPEADGDFGLLEEGLSSLVATIPLMDGLVALHLMRSDAALSVPLDGEADRSTANDFYLIGECTTSSVPPAINDGKSIIAALPEKARFMGTESYALMWELSKAELAA